MTDKWDKHHQSTSQEGQSSVDGSSVETTTDSRIDQSPNEEPSNLETELKTIIDKLSPLLKPQKPSKKETHESSKPSAKSKPALKEKKVVIEEPRSPKFEKCLVHRNDSESSERCNCTKNEVTVSTSETVNETSNATTAERHRPDLGTSSQSIPPVSSSMYNQRTNAIERQKRATKKRKEPSEPLLQKCRSINRDFLDPSLERENIDRYNYNHVAFSRPRKKIKWSTYVPNIPGISHISKLYNPLRKGTGRKDHSSDESAMTIPQLYKAQVTNGSTPHRFTFRAVSGTPYGFNDSMPNLGRDPSGYSREMSDEQYMQMRHFPNRANYSPLLKQADPNYSFPPSAVGHRPRVRIYEGEDALQDCVYPYKDDKSFAIDPEKARAFLGEKGEGYISVNTIPERVDVYCFDQLNTGFFRTSDHPPPLIADVAIETSEAISSRFWAEVFGFVHVVLAFVLAMLLQLFKFVLLAIVRPVMIGVIQLFSDYFIKPLLTVIYNGFTQPLSIFIYNILASLRDLVNPIAKAMGFFVDIFANVLKACRCVEIKHVYTNQPGVPLIPK